MNSRGARGLLAARTMNTAADLTKAIGMMWCAVACTGVLSGIAIWVWASGESDRSFVFLVTLSCLTTISLFIRVLRVMRVRKSRILHRVDWTSAALAPERITVMGFLLLMVFAGVATTFYRGESLPLPAEMQALVFSAFLGLPLVEIFVTKARPWRLFVNGHDPD